MIKSPSGRYGAGAKGVFCFKKADIVTMSTTGKSTRKKHKYAFIGIPT